MSEAITESKHLMSEAITDHQRSSEAKERRRGTRQWVVCMQDSLGLALYAGWPGARVACRMARGSRCMQDGPGTGMPIGDAIECGAKSGCARGLEPVEPRRDQPRSDAPHSGGAA